MERISVFLDDIRNAPDGYLRIETIDECIDILQRFEIEHLSLDHDLVSKHRNGTLLVEMMIQKQLYANRITIHSANAPRGKAMYNSFKQAQLDSLMPLSIAISLRPLPLWSYSDSVVKYYVDTF
ncbi:cyclic-phosphate processing receiver domain-containing protein [Peribacillus sp. SCS-26]|uniref:cyclic-phosphate processing receiver domain-containing protein n=1 Tax=Paraperibacillus marinus TaxID=3115295 RepID=UPI003905BBEB